MKLAQLIKVWPLLLLCTHSFMSQANQVQFERPDRGEPISENERQRATDEFITLMQDTQYFDFVDSRIHGMPENNSNGAFWWATIWTGVDVKKLNGRVTYTHNNQGTDNSGIFTSPYLESACYAYLLTGDRKFAHLSRKLMRGLSSWILSSSKTIGDTPKILSRAFYSQSVYSNDGGLDLFFNYEASRPGLQSGGPSDFVHIPHNPFFGDIWVKNNRSIDDIGHMIRAMAQMQACRNSFDDEARADLDQMNELYANWARDVDVNDFSIPTLNQKGEAYVPKHGVGDYNNYKMAGTDPNCVGKLAVRFLHATDANNLTCGKGISFLEKLGSKYLKNDAIEILRSHHVAAVAMAELRSRPAIAFKLRQGLVERMERDFLVAKNHKLSPKFYLQDIPTFFIHANNVGVPMTSQEMRFVYDRLHMAFVGMRDPIYHNTFHLFDSSVPDGAYSYDPPDVGLFFRALGPMIGSCTSAFRNSTGRQLFDCERLKAHLFKASEGTVSLSDVSSQSKNFVAAASK